MLQYLHGPIDKFKKYGNVPNSIDIAKFLAIIIMVTDHVGFYFFPDNLLLRAIGRIGFPIWFFFAGYSRPSKFSYEIVTLAIILAIIKTSVFLPVFPINALFTIILCRMFSDFLRKKDRILHWQLFNLIVVFIVLLIWFVPTSIIFEYGTLALMFTICGVLQRELPGKLQTSVAFIFATVSFVFVEYLVFGFSVAQFFIMAAGTVFIMHFLSGLVIKPFPYLEKFGLVTKTGMFLARNSLYFYFLHIALFAIMAKIFFPEQDMFFKWF